MQRCNVRPEVQPPIARNRPSSASTCLTPGLGEGFDTAFAVCVLLGALWLLVSGYA